MIIIIDILGPARGDDEPEILSRIIDHARSGRDVRKKARRILAGVDSIGARGVRVLDRDGTQIFSTILRRRRRCGRGSTIIIR